MKTLTAGTRAPDFHLPDQDGKMQELSELLLRGPVVLFFFPTAGSGGCTREAVHFRDLVTRFAGAGAHRIGISIDDILTMEGFAENELLDFPLLADIDGSVAEAYGVRRRFITPVKRATFVIDEDQQVVEVIQSETSMHIHADRALEVLGRLA
ncbi:MAG: peroxiredoxin [Lapillicoccus sp.]